MNHSWKNKAFQRIFLGFLSFSGFLKFRISLRAFRCSLPMVQTIAYVRNSTAALTTHTLIKLLI